MTALLTSASTRAQSADVLDRIRDPECNLAIWQRDPLPGVENIYDDATNDVRFTSSLASLPTKLTEAMEAAGFKDAPRRIEFENDVFDLARRYCETMRLDEAEVRLEIVTTDSCRKWHSDYVSARLITTYVGTGTDWLENYEAARVKDGHEPSRFETLGTGHVGLFKGKLATDFPAVHRSPKISGSGERRLLLVLNPVEKA